MGDLLPIQDIMLTPGACSEACRVFVGRIDATGAGGVFGLASEGEDILVKVLPFAEAYAMVERNEVDNRLASSACSGWPFIARNCASAGVDGRH